MRAAGRYSLYFSMLLAGIILSAVLFLRVPAAWAASIFLEAEDFQSPAKGWQAGGGWGWQLRSASGQKVLWGGPAFAEATADKMVDITEAGSYRIWARYSRGKQPAPFKLELIAPGGQVASYVYATGKADPKMVFDKYLIGGEKGGPVEEDGFIWEGFDVELSPGSLTLRIGKEMPKDWSRDRSKGLLDCFILTTDKVKKPDFLDYGPQTYMRVKFGNSYDKPVYLYVFADHYRSPYYGFYALTAAGTEDAMQPAKTSSCLKAGETTPWCNISRMLFQDSGARLQISARYTYYSPAPCLQARIEIATAPDEKAIVKRIEIDRTPGGMSIIMPPDFTTPERVAVCWTDMELADRMGRIADSLSWPTYGRKPLLFPVFATGEDALQPGKTPPDLLQREIKTLSYFGTAETTGSRRYIGGGIWLHKNRCYLQPDIVRMKETARRNAEAFRKEGLAVEDIVYCVLQDEPGGQEPEHLSSCPVCKDAFQKWLREEVKMTPQQLLVSDWDAVRPVNKADRDKQPALYYFTQRFGVRALASTMRVQQEILHEAYGGSFPVNANFSDTTVASASLYTYNLDYFELLADGRLNAIWSEDWSGIPSTNQCAAFNVALMQAAARRHGQHVGLYQVASGYKALDLKLKAAGAVARGAKALTTFAYGPFWRGHMTSVWSNRPEVWRSQAEIFREIGGAEDLLVKARPVKAQTAILYSSSSDIWTAERNRIYGFERMHAWLAMAHAQVPVDILSERDAEEGLLKDYKVCYLFGPNLTGAVAIKLKEWTQAGGTLVLTPGAGNRDEYNRPMQILNDILPAERKADVEELQRYNNYAKFLTGLKEQDKAVMGATSIKVFSLRERLQPRMQAESLASFTDASAALLRRSAGKGMVYQYGFLPAVAYIIDAMRARNALEARAEGKDGGEDAAAIRVGPVRIKQPLPDDGRLKAKSADGDLLGASYNPWQYSGDIREAVLRPIREAGVRPPVGCSLPLVDAVLMESPEGMVIALSNWSLRPLPEVKLRIRTGKRIGRVESVRSANLSFKQTGDGETEILLPLQDTDYVKLYYAK